MHRLYIGGELKVPTVPTVRMDRGPGAEGLAEEFEIAGAENDVVAVGHHINVTGLFEEVLYRGEARLGNQRIPV